MELRRVAPLLGLALAVVLAFTLSSMTRAESVQPTGTLLSTGADLVVDDCAHPFDGSATVHFPAGAFDPDPMVHIEVSDEAGWSSGTGDTWPHFRGLVHVHVPAHSEVGVDRVSVTVTGVRHGNPVELRDSFTVSVRCAAR